MRSSARWRGLQGKAASTALNAWLRRRVTVDPKLEKEIRRDAGAPTPRRPCTDENVAARLRFSSGPPGRRPHLFAPGNTEKLARGKTGVEALQQRNRAASLARA